MHDISSNLLPPNIANLLIILKYAFMLVTQGHLQEVTILLSSQDLTNELNPFQEMV